MRDMSHKIEKREEESEMLSHTMENRGEWHMKWLQKAWRIACREASLLHGRAYEFVCWFYVVLE